MKIEFVRENVIDMTEISTKIMKEQKNSVMESEWFVVVAIIQY